MLTDKIAADMKEAMRAKDAPRLSTLRMLKSAVEYHKIEKKQEQLTDADVTAVIKKQIKQRQDSIEGFEKGGRADLVEKEKAEIVVLKSYLPEKIFMMHFEEVVQSTVMCNVMKAVQAKVAGRADNRLVSQIVSASLA
jgi:uncharacterized protein YqeY